MIGLLSFERKNKDLIASAKMIGRTAAAAGAEFHDTRLAGNPECAAAKQHVVNACITTRMALSSRNTAGAPPMSIPSSSLLPEKMEPESLRGTLVLFQDIVLHGDSIGTIYSRPDLGTSMTGLLPIRDD